MKKLVSCFAVASLLALGGTAIADLCTIEATPAATLLLPYFEVDLDNPQGVDTFFSINNASAASVLTHVIIWTDLSVEALDFQVFLTGYDVQTIGMGLLIRDGVLPRTGDSVSISPVGLFSDCPPSGCDTAIDAYPRCGLVLPYVNPALDADYLAHLQSILTGGPSEIYNGRCGGLDYGDNIARGYVTVDVVSDCGLETPCDPGYFYTDGQNTARGEYDNVLWGDWYMLNQEEFLADADTLVHIEAANPADQIGIDTLNGTFYGRCGLDLDNPAASPWFDLREPLPTSFAAHYFQNDQFVGNTDYFVWRDSVMQYLIPDLLDLFYGTHYGDEGHAGFNCNIGPLWFPISQRQIVVFDNAENPGTLCTISPCPEEDILFPAETARYPVVDMEVTPQSGWMYMNLNQGPFSCDGTICSIGSQAWVTAIHSSEGRYSGGLSAVQLDNFCDNSSIILGLAGPDFPYDELFYNYFTSYYNASGEKAGRRDHATDGFPYAMKKAQRVLGGE
jgi:hypothetical protein